MGIGSVLAGLRSGFFNLPLTKPQCTDYDISMAAIFTVHHDININRINRIHTNPCILQSKL